MEMSCHLMVASSASILAIKTVKFVMLGLVCGACQVGRLMTLATAPLYAVME